MKILLIDDDAGIHETMNDILMWKNIDVITACNDFEALNIANKNEFDIGLIDLRMPGIDGIETFKRIKKIKPTFKAFLITAFVNDAQVKEAMKAGISGVFEKPVEITTLIEAIGNNIVKLTGTMERMKER